MGVQGLKRFLTDKYSKSSHQVHLKSQSAEFDHVLIDMNSVLHSCIAQKPLAATLADVMLALEKIMHTATPTKTLVVVVDGPAPIAKIPVQRARRRQAGLTIKQSDVITKLDLTPGTQFLAHLTQTITAWAMKYMQASKHADTLTVKISGDNIAGEGESKIFQSVQELIKKSCEAGKTDATNDQFCIVGNDTDLVLGAVCMTRAVNFFILDAHTGDSFAVGDLLCCWIGQVQGMPMKHFIGDTLLLPQARLTFALSQMLAGNDFLPPVQGCEASHVWGAISVAFPNTPSIVSVVDTATFSLNTAAFANLLSATNTHKAKTAPTGREDTSTVQAYLKGLMWCLASLCGFGCTDYSYAYPRSEAGPHVNAIITWCRANKRGVRPPQEPKNRPPAPLEYLACVLPLEAWWLAGDEVCKAAGESTGKKRKQRSTEVEVAIAQLSQASEPDAVVDSVRVVLKNSGVKGAPRMLFGTPHYVKKSPPAEKIRRLTALQPASRVPKLSPKDFQQVCVWQTADNTAFRPFIPDKQPYHQLTNHNPYTHLDLDIPVPKRKKRAEKAAVVKTGISLSSCMDMDEEV